MFVSLFVFVFVSVLLTKNANGIIVGQDVSPDGWTCLKLDLVSIQHKLIHLQLICTEFLKKLQTETGKVLNSH